MGRKRVQEIKEKYSKGIRIRLIEMKGESQMHRGLEGTVDYVDDMGQIHMNWDNRSSLALILGEDDFEVISD